MPAAVRCDGRVAIVSGDVAALLGELKGAVGAGGLVRDGDVEVCVCLSFCVRVRACACVRVFACGLFVSSQAIAA